MGQQADLASATPTEVGKNLPGETAVILAEP